jgi:hypothetical protein
LLAVDEEGMISGIFGLWVRNVTAEGSGHFRTPRKTTEGRAAWIRVTSGCL